MEIQPKDPSKGHFYVSLVKSVVRIAAGSALILASIPETGIYVTIGSTLFDVYLITAGSLLILAEVLGIVEELV